MKQILEKCGEPSIDAHHLCTDFLAAYDTMEKGNMECNA